MRYYIYIYIYIYVVRGERVNKRRHQTEMQLIWPRFEHNPSEIQVIIQLVCSTKVIFSDLRKFLNCIYCRMMDKFFNHLKSTHFVPRREYSFLPLQKRNTICGEYKEFYCSTWRYM